MANNNWKNTPGIGMLRRTLFLMAVCGIVSFVLLLARGTISDRKGFPLAVSASVDNVYLSPVEIASNGEDKELIADGLSEILGIPRDEICEKASREGSWYVTVARKVERETAQRIREFKNEYGIRGVRLETDTKRYYPNATLCCHLIGFVGTDNSGLEGIEAQYNAFLEGSAGKTLREVNAYGAEPLFEEYAEHVAGARGCDLATTIDSTIQYYIEKHLKQAVVDYDVLNGAGAIAMDVDTGAILAMASLEKYDPNDFLAVSERDQAAVDAAPDPEARDRSASSDAAARSAAGRTAGTARRR